MGISIFLLYLSAWSLGVSFLTVVMFATFSGCL